MRAPDQVMRLQRLGASFPTKVSFVRQLLRRMSSTGTTVDRIRWNIGDDGFGDAVYAVRYCGHVYSLVAFSCPLSDDQRSDRVIAQAWDTSFVLYDGIPDDATIDRLRENVPLQERGRFDERVFVLSRANKSVRFFEYVVDCLSRGVQPQSERLQEVGYLVRTTAVYGNGKFGMADRFMLAARDGLGSSFAAEMMTVWLIREFSQDLVEHLAKVRNPEGFVPLSAETRRAIGVGNSTGLGMAPFLVTHPKLFNNWMTARETALERVSCKPSLTEDEKARFKRLRDHTDAHLAQWNVEDQALKGRISILRREWAETASWDRLLDSDDFPVRRMLSIAETMGLDFQELLAALLIEMADDVFDDLEASMTATHEGGLAPAMSVGRLLQLLNRNYGWALTIPFERASETAQFWYVSEEKLEPRLGRRDSEPGSDLELPLDIARQAQSLAGALENWPKQDTVGDFLAARPEYRYIVRRVQISEEAPYGEIRDNLLSEQCLPIDMLRCKLAFFGASKFDPRSDRWTRITLFQGAPSAAEILKGETDHCWLPVL